MKIVVFIVALLTLQILCCCLHAQIIAGDTSFTTYSAFNKVIKTHPQAQFVTDTLLQEIVRENNIVYKQNSFRPLLVDMFKPLADSLNRHVPIILLHGGGWRSGNRQQHHPLAAKLAGKGYVCFTPEYRLSAEALFPAAVEDVYAMIAWVKMHAAQLDIDADKLVLAGFSAGGELAVFTSVTAAQAKDKFTAEKWGDIRVKALIDIDGTLSFVHPESTEGNDQKSLSAATRWLGCPRADCFEKWVLASPLTYVDANTPPTLFLNSSVAGMHAGRGDYIKILNQHGIYSEVQEWPDAPHSFCLFEPWFSPTAQKIDHFLQKVLQLKPTP